MKNTYIRVKDRTDLVRDKNSKAILNTNLNELNKYREEREFKMNLNRVIKENEEIKSEISEIKTLLLKILEQR
jgi:hypothetical protein